MKPMQFYLLQRMPFRLGHAKSAKDPPENAEQPVEPEGSGWSYSIHDTEKRERDEEVESPVRDGGHTHGQPAYSERVDL